MNRGTIQYGLISGIVGIMGLIFGGSAYFSGIKTDIAVHETKITSLEKIAENQDQKLTDIYTTLNAIAIKLEVQNAIHKVATSTTRSLNSVNEN